MHYCEQAFCIQAGRPYTCKLACRSQFPNEADEENYDESMNGCIREGVASAAAATVTDYDSYIRTERQSDYKASQL